MADGEDRMRRGYARGRARDEAIRAELEPLAPGEYPLGLKLAIGLCGVLAIGNAVAFLTGNAGDQSPVAGVVFLIAIVAIGVGLVRQRYLAVLCFQGLLGLSLVYAVLSLAFVSNLTGVLLSGGLVVIGAPVFWLLVRVMARLQAPPR